MSEKISEKKFPPMISKEAYEIMEQVIKVLNKNGHNKQTIKKYIDGSLVDSVLKDNDTEERVVIFVDYHNPCCDFGQHKNKYKSQDQLIKEKAKIVTIWTIPKSKLEKVTGDDWDDAPSCSNAESPSNIEGLEKIEICLGEKID